MKSIEAISNAGKGIVRLDHKDGTSTVVHSDNLQILPVPPKSEGELPDLDIRVHTLTITKIEDGGKNNIRIRTTTGSFVTSSDFVDINVIPAQYDRPADLDVRLQEVPQIFGRHSVVLLEPTAAAAK